MLVGNCGASRVIANYSFCNMQTPSNDCLPNANGRSVRAIQAALESSNDPRVLVRLKPEAYECLDRSRTRVTHRANRPPTVSTISGVNSA
jgi:hypothetical protein